MAYHPTSPDRSPHSSQAGLAAIRAGQLTAARPPQPLALLDLIDAYATARADRDESYHECAGWAFDTAHTAMLTARAAVASALGIPADGIPAPRDPITRAAEISGGAL